MPIEVRQHEIARYVREQLATVGDRGDVALAFGSGSRDYIWTGDKPLHRISLADYDSVERLEPQDFFIVLQPGVRLGKLHTLLEAENLKFPFLTKDSIGTAGGMAASGKLYDGELWYDITRWVLAVEVILADGTVSRSGAVTYKSVAGYDLPRLFSSSFGTLGVVSEISLRLYPLSARAYGKNLFPVRQRIPEFSPLGTAVEPQSAAGKIAFRLKQALDPAGIFPIITGWNATGN